MNKTLVLVVDRDDDYGVKAHVKTPVIGVNNCLDAARDFGIADPEDSDLNALYAAVSVCIELQNDGVDAEVALICGHEKVGHRSDMAVVEQLEYVLQELSPTNVVLVGDGAEDEYLYPIISSRVHVDSVRRVFVKQAPGLEGSLYVVTRMLSDPGKRKRFLVPIGLVLMLLALFFLVPMAFVYFKEQDFNIITSMSGSLALFTVGAVVTIYGYSIGNRLGNFKQYVATNLVRNSISMIFLFLSLAVIVLGAIWTVMEIKQMYIVGSISAVVYFLLCMVWPVGIAIYMYIIGRIINQLQNAHTFALSNLFICLNVTSIAFVLTGIFDLTLDFLGSITYTGMAYPEIIVGVLLSVFGNFLKSRVNSKVEDDAVQ